MKAYGVKREKPCCPGHDTTVWVGETHRRTQTVQTLHRLARKRARRDAKREVQDGLGDLACS